jgi:hypothetical protein
VSKDWDEISQNTKEAFKGLGLFLLWVGNACFYAMILIGVPLIILSAIWEVMARIFGPHSDH